MEKSIRTPEKFARLYCNECDTNYFITEEKYNEMDEDEENGHCCPNCGTTQIEYDVAYSRLPFLANGSVNPNSPNAWK